MPWPPSLADARTGVLRLPLRARLLHAAGILGRSAAVGGRAAPVR